jgi:hypothetical protein
LQRAVGIGGSVADEGVVVGRAGQAGQHDGIVRPVVGHVAVDLELVMGDEIVSHRWVFWTDHEQGRGQHGHQPARRQRDVA